MKIETKYNVGDEVYWLGNDHEDYRPNHGTVYKIYFEVASTCLSNPPDVFYSGVYYTVFTPRINVTLGEGCFFPTQAECHAECDRLNEEKK